MLVSYVAQDNQNPSPVPASLADHAQEPARYRKLVTRDVQMDSDGDEPGGRVMKKGAPASNTDVVCYYNCQTIPCKSSI